MPKEHREAVGVDPMAPIPFRMTRVQRETADTFTMSLSPLVKGGFHFQPGQFNMLYLFGKGEVPISISGDPDRPDHLIHTVRKVGLVTRAMGALKKNAIIGVRGPFGTAWPVEDAVGQDVVIMAGGIGLAPLRPAIYQIFKNRKRYGRVALLYGARSPKDMLYHDELLKWRGRFDAQVEATVDNGTPEWSGHIGVVTSLIPWTNFDPLNTVAMVCGPEVMMRFGVRDLLREGIKSENVYVSMERNMRCAIGLCGHCQYGPEFVCKDGPVFQYSRLEPFFDIREL